ncbi:MAG: M20/M25/M40 family metallo-hydrolase [Anaerolineae bacterium]|nr:M20/M25/M40 family metallo-hydrolase [Anaerolineae bacterium]
MTIDWDAIGRDAIATLSRYIQFDTTNPPGNELPAAHWLADQLRDRGITDDVAVHEPAPGRGLVLARIPGSEPLKPLLVNHHMDVVAADPAQWTHPPFSGAVADGYVWGRGTLDTKNLGIIFLLALESLRKAGARFRRPVIFLAVPDEETGGKHGMAWVMEKFADRLNPEWVWDEGGGGFKDMFGPGVMFGLTVVEKQIQHLRLVAKGKPGHASMPHNDNANVTLLNALKRVLDAPRPLRVNAITRAMFHAIAQTQKFPASALLKRLDNPLALRLVASRLQKDNSLNAMLRDTVSLTILRSGYKVNVIPERAEAEIDCRLLPDTDAGEFHAWLKGRLADERIQVEITESSPPSGVAPLEGAFFDAVKAAIHQHMPEAGVFPMLVPGGTDGRYWRQRGYAAYGFAPVVMERGDLGRVHGIDERISGDNLLTAIKITRDIIEKLCVA